MRRNKLDESEAKLLEEVVSKHRPDLLPLLGVVGARPLTAEEREGLRDPVATELVDEGFDEEDEPNALGLALEDLIDRLGHLSEDA